MSIFRTYSADSPTPKITNGEANIGEMNFAIVDMGQGDCTIISDPNNNVYVIDCGSIDRMPEKSMITAQALLRKWAAGNTIELIITHPDQDHYNKFWDLLVEAAPTVNVKNIYFSRAQSDTSPLGNYSVGYFSSNLKHFGNPDLIEVTLNETKDELKIWSKSTAYRVPKTEPIVSTFELARGKVKTKAWSISIIAGNVMSNNYIRKADKNNTASLVTLVQFDYLKLLLTGDSTSETFTFLEENHASEIRDVDTFQIPHHGSESSMPEASFVELVNPKSLVVSVGLLSSSFFLPKKSIIDAWLKSKALRKGSFIVDYWVLGNKKYNSIKMLNKILNEVWDGYKVYQSGNFWWLKDPEDAEESGTIFYGFSNRDYFLYRITSKKEIWITGVEGSLWNQKWKDVKVSKFI